MNKQQTNHYSSADNLPVDQMVSEKEGPCVSVLVNLFTPGNMLKQNITNLKRSLERATQSIDISQMPENMKASLKDKLESLAGEFQNTGKSLGLGMFISPKISLLVEFPFPIIECSIVGNSFETRDLLYMQQYLEPYYALSITKDSMRLYKGRGQSLEEITNEAFPKHHSDEFEYEHASIGSSHGYSLKGFEKDKGEIENVRLETFVKSVARDLAATINDPNAQVVVAGPARLANEVESVYPYPENLLRVDSSFNGKTFNKFSEVAWQKVTEAKKNHIENAIKRVGELPLNHKAEGLRDVWEAANEGRGLLLLVERDFQRMAYQLSGTSSIRLHPPKERYDVIADAVDDVIEIVRNKHGRVIFTETHELNRYDGIVLTLRY